jgi:hypothetical protein
VSTFFDFDPITGLRTDMHYDEETGTATLNHTQDLSAFVDKQATLRNTGATDSGIKKGMWHYASIPAFVQIEMRKKGLDIYSKDKTMLNRVLREIDENYSYLKTTNKTHRVSENRHR